MVWAGIMLHGHTPRPCIWKNSVTDVKCRNDILEPYARLYKDAVNLDFILINYDARDRACVVDKFLESEAIHLTY